MVEAACYSCVEVAGDVRMVLALIRCACCNQQSSMDTKENEMQERSANNDKGLHLATMPLQQ